MLFGSTFTFASLLIVLVTSLDLRTDAYRILWLYKRPVGHRAQNIGIFFIFNEHLFNSVLFKKKSIKHKKKVYG
jgi:hypothetical protein